MNMSEHNVTEVWGEVKSYTNGELDFTLYHCTTTNGNFDFWVDADGTLTDVTPSVINPTA
jgi:hypothetical protein